MIRLPALVARGTRTLIDASAGQRSEAYPLVTTVLNTDHTTTQIVAPYHERWETETALCEMKQTIPGARVLRARTPARIDHETYPLLPTHPALRIAIAATTPGQRHINPDRTSFTIALHAARDQVIPAATVIADTVIADTVIDLVGVIGHHVLDNLIPARRRRPPRGWPNEQSPTTPSTPRQAGSEDPAEHHHQDRHRHDRRSLTRPPDR